MTSKSMTYVFGVYPEGIAYGSGKKYISSEFAGEGAMTLEDVEARACRLAAAHRAIRPAATYAQMYTGRYVAQVSLPCEACRERRAKEDAAWRGGETPAKARKCRACGGLGATPLLSLIVG